MAFPVYPSEPRIKHPASTAAIPMPPSVNAVADAERWAAVADAERWAVVWMMVSVLLFVCVSMALVVVCAQDKALSRLERSYYDLRARAIYLEDEIDYLRARSARVETMEKEIERLSRERLQLRHDQVIEDACDSTKCAPGCAYVALVENEAQR